MKMDWDLMSARRSGAGDQHSNWGGARVIAPGTPSYPPHYQSLLMRGRTQWADHGVCCAVEAGSACKNCLAIDIKGFQVISNHKTDLGASTGPRLSSSHGFLSSIVGAMELRESSPAGTAEQKAARERNQGRAAVEHIFAASSGGCESEGDRICAPLRLANSGLPRTWRSSGLSSICWVGAGDFSSGCTARMAVI
jgi:hypothetical protein